MRLIKYLGRVHDDGMGHSHTLVVEACRRQHLLIVGLQHSTGTDTPSVSTRHDVTMRMPACTMTGGLIRRACARVSN